MLRLRTKRKEPGDESATKSNQRYLLAAIGLAAAIFLGRLGGGREATPAPQPFLSHPNLDAVAAG